MNEKLRAAVEAALEALENDCDWRVRSDASRGLRAALAESDSDWSLLAETQESLFEHMAEIHQLRAALAKQEDAKPTAWCWVAEGMRGPLYHGPGPDADIAARAAAAETPRTVQYLWDGPPPRREWQGLTDEEITRVRRQFDNMYAVDWSEIVRAAEAALKEKNT